MALRTHSESRRLRPWPTVLLALLCAGAVVAAVLIVGPKAAATATSRIVTAQQGIIQSTVSGSGNVEPAAQLDVNFATGGTVSSIDVSAGQHVTAGKVLAKLDPDADE